MGFLESITEWDQQMLLLLNSYHLPWLDRFMWLLSETLMWLPFLLTVIVVLIKNKHGQAFLMILTFVILIIITDQISSGLIKPWVARFRPSHDPEIGNLVQIVHNYKGGNYGFISSHAANVFAFAGLSLLLFRNWLYTLAVLLWATAVSYSRIYLGVHFPLDVICGAALGFLSSIAIFYLYKFLIQYSSSVRIYADRRSEQMTSTNFKKADLYSLVFVLLMTIIMMLLASVELAW